MFFVSVALHFMRIVRIFFIIRTHVPAGIGEVRDPGSSAHVEDGLLSAMRIPVFRVERSDLGPSNKRWLYCAVSCVC